METKNKYDPRVIWDKIIADNKKGFKSEGEYWRRMANALRKRNIRNREKVKALESKIADLESKPADIELLKTYEQFKQQDSPDFHQVNQVEKELRVRGWKLNNKKQWSWK